MLCTAMFFNIKALTHQQNNKRSYKTDHEELFVLRCNQFNSSELVKGTIIPREARS
jgi:hypothetical protein